MNLLVKLVFLWLHGFLWLLSSLMAPVFTWLYEDRGKMVQAPSNPILSKSATELGRMIRNKEVCVLNGETAD